MDPLLSETFISVACQKVYVTDVAKQTRRNTHSHTIIARAVGVTVKGGWSAGLE